MRRNTTDHIRQCLPILASGISQSGRPLHSSSLSHLCNPGDQTQCRTVTRENNHFCLQQFRCATARVSWPVDTERTSSPILFY